MESKLVRPVLVETDDKSSILVLDDNSQKLSISEPNKAAWGHRKLILVSLDPEDRIEVGDIIAHPLDSYTSLVTEDPQYYNKQKLKEYGYKKVVATQEQLSPELIQKIINEYNNLGMKDFEIEMYKLGFNISAEFPYHSLLPKLTNGFIIPVIKEEKLYTKSEVIFIMNNILNDVLCNRSTKLHFPSNSNEIGMFVNDYFNHH